MSEVFDDRVEYAIQNIWVNFRSGNGEQAMRGLQEAAQEGNGDACYFLARCYSGPCYVDPGFGFESDDDKAEEWYNKSIELGSAVGMMGAMRVGGFKPRCGSFVHEPYTSKREIWDKVVELARGGQIFCKYMVANAYYYGDAVELAGLKINGAQDVCSLQRKAIQIYEEILAQGMAMGLGNLIDILTSGDYGMPVDKERARRLEERGAELGVGVYEVKVGLRYVDTQPTKAMELFKSAAEHVNSNGYYEMGRMYSYRSKTVRNLNIAKEYFEKAIQMNSEAVGSYNLLGEIYFKGGDGLEVNYQAAAQCFLKAIDINNWCSDMLGTCYLHGLGVPQDYARAKELFENCPDARLSCIGLGEIYAYGLGVPEDIGKGMVYWNKFAQDPAVAEHKKHFKKTLFGWKKI